MTPVVEGPTGKGAPDMLCSQPLIAAHGDHQRARASKSPFGWAGVPEMILAKEQQVRSAHGHRETGVLPHAASWGPSLGASCLWVSVFICPGSVSWALSAQ